MTMLGLSRMTMLGLSRMTAEYLLDLDVEVLRDPAPERHLLAHELRELRGRVAGDRHRAHLAVLVDGPRIVHDLDGDLVELVDDRFACAPGHVNALPRAEIELGES